MSDYIDSNLQATYGAEFFDYDAASGEYHDSMLSSDVAENFDMGNIAWNETWHNFPMTNNDQVASCQTFEGIATNDTAWTAMEPAHPQQQSGSTTALCNLPEKPNLCTFDSAAFQNNDYAFQSSAPIEAHDHPNFDTLQQTEPGSSQWHAQDQKLQGSSMITWCCLQRATNLMSVFSPIGATAAPEPAHDQSATKDSPTTFPQRVISCGWKGCESGHYVFRADGAEAKQDLTIHKNILLQSWKGPTTCDWSNCSSSRVFKDKYTLNEHLTNIHVTPLCCSITGCSVGPFGKKSDLNRHTATIHGKTAFFCPIESCESKSTGFPRKDKLVKHMREEHDNVRCSLNHCGAVILDGQQEEHIQNYHGEWECALMACQRGQPSHFTVERARLHLIGVHKMNPTTALYSLSRAEKRPADHIIHPRNLGIYPINPLVECHGCLEFASKTN